MNSYLDHVVRKIKTRGAWGHKVVVPAMLHKLNLILRSSPVWTVNDLNIFYFSERIKMILLSILLGFIVRGTYAGTWVLVGDRGKFRKTVKKTVWRKKSGFILFPLQICKNPNVYSKIKLHKIPCNNFAEIPRNISRENRVKMLTEIPWISHKKFKNFSGINFGVFSGND